MSTEQSLTQREAHDLRRWAHDRLGVPWRQFRYPPTEWAKYGAKRRRARGKR